LRARALPERVRGVFTTRHYTNQRLPLPLPYLESYFSILDGGISTRHPCMRDIDYRLITFKSISLRQGVSGQSWIHVANAFRAKIDGIVCRFVLD